MGTESGTRKESVPIEDLAQTECPVSIIHRFPDMEYLLSEVTSAMNVRSTTRAMVFGMNSAKWDTHWYDAVNLYGGEENRIELAKREVTERR